MFKRLHTARAWIVKRHASQRLRVILINEYGEGSGAPTGALVADLARELSAQSHVDVAFFCMSRPYKTGGLRRERLVHLFLMHFALPFVLLAARVRSMLDGSRVCLVVTTSPPLIQWTACLVGRILGIPSLFWLQDAHPELEARLLESRGFKRIAKALRGIDRIFVNMASAVVTLDDAMLQELVRRTGFAGQTSVIAPWVTFVEPSVALRVPSELDRVRLLYAGNFGHAHDLQPLVDQLGALSREQQGNVTMTFVGMDIGSRNKIEQALAKLATPRQFLPRFPQVAGLLAIMPEFDFGIVSLRSDHAGIACPSKAFTYLSQGLAILYVGPPGTLSWRLCQEGWGLTVEDLFGDEPEAALRKTRSHAGVLFPNPAGPGRQSMAKLVQSLATGNKRPT